MKCEECRYCASEGNFEGAVCRCKKNPPIGHTYVNNYDKYDCVGVWPRVQKNDRCGHFLAKPESEEGVTK